MSKTKIDEDDLLSKIDFSVISLALKAGGTLLEQVLNGMQCGTTEIKCLLFYEADFILECNVCRNLFRSFPLFIAHKRIYCTTEFQDANERTFATKLPEQTEDIIVVEPTMPDEPNIAEKEGTSRRAQTSFKDENETQKEDNDESALRKMLAGTFTGKSSAYCFYTQAAEKVEATKSTKRVGSTITMTPIPTNKNAVFMTVSKSGTDGVTKPHVSDLIAQRIEARKSGKKKTMVNIEKCFRGHIDLSLNRCRICKFTFNRKNDLLSHMEVKHSEAKWRFPCCICKKKFSYFKGVTRHVMTIHNKTKIQVDKMKAKLKALAYQETLGTPSGTAKSSKNTDEDQNMSEDEDLNSSVKEEEDDDNDDDYEEEEENDDDDDDTTLDIISKIDKSRTSRRKQLRINSDNNQKGQCSTENKKSPVKTELQIKGQNTLTQPVKTQLEVPPKMGNRGKSKNKCHICKSVFSSWHILQSHINSKHSESPLRYPCCFCDKELGYFSGLTRHIVVVHKKTRNQVDTMRKMLRARAYRKKLDNSTVPRNTAGDSSSPNTSGDEIESDVQFEFLDLKKTTASPRSSGKNGGFSIVPKTEIDPTDQQMYMTDFIGQKSKSKMFRDNRKDHNEKGESSNTKTLNAKSTANIKQQTKRQKMLSLQSVKGRNDLPPESCIRRDIDLKKTKCLLCNLKFKNRKGLMAHVQVKHSGAQWRFPCCLCDKEFAYSKTLHRHLLKIHKKSRNEIEGMKDELKAQSFQAKADIQIGIAIDTGGNKSIEAKSSPSKKTTSLACLSEGSVSNVKKLKTINSAVIKIVKLKTCNGCKKKFLKKSVYDDHTLHCKMFQLQNKEEENEGETADSETDSLRSASSTSTHVRVGSSETHTRSKSLNRSPDSDTASSSRVNSSALSSLRASSRSDSTLSPIKKGTKLIIQDR